MFTSELNTATRQLSIELFNGSHTRTEIFKIRSVDHAIELWQSNIARNIIYVMLRWVKQREWTMKHTRTMTDQAQHAIDRTRLLLEMHAESRLHVVVAKVLQQGRDLDLLVPGDKSRYRRHYDNVIQPIREWAAQYADRLEVHATSRRHPH